MIREIFIIILLFSITLLYLKKYFHLLVIMAPYLITITFINIKETNQGKEILDLFLIFLIILYILISIVSKIFQKYINNRFINKLNVISIGFIWGALYLLNIIIKSFNGIMSFENLVSLFNIIIISYLLKKELKDKQ